MKNYQDLIHKELSFQIVGLLYTVHNELGRKGRNKVDFIIDDKIILELKVKRRVGRIDFYQLQRYLRALDKKLGILVNFQQLNLTPKRILNSDKIDY